MSVMAGRARAHAEIARMLTFRVKDAPSEIGPDGFPVPGAPPSTPLRFPVGATVLCHVQRWERAVIVKHWYREANWETGKLVLPQPCARFVFTRARSCLRYAPYQALVQSNNTLVYVPLDNTAYIRPYYSETQPELTQEPCATCSR
jgi:hypothetical protein